MCFPADDASNSARPLRSSSSPIRPRGVCATTLSVPSFSKSPSPILLGNNPGAIAFTVKSLRTASYQSRLAAQIEKVHYVCGHIVSVVLVKLGGERCGLHVALEASPSAAAIHGALAGGATLLHRCQVAWMQVRVQLLIGA